MKRLLFFSILSIFCLTISAQTKTWIGPSGGSFNVVTNWSPAGIPNIDHDVVIPSGSNILMDGANVNSFVSQGNTTITITHQFNVSSASSFSSNTTITWNSGNLAGQGTITNNGTINMMTSNTRSLQGTFTLINKGTLNINSTGDFRFGNGTPTLNNATSGVINLNTTGKIAGFNGTGTLKNFGTIKKSQNNGTYQILNHFTNEGGTITVEKGTLKLSPATALLNNGSYNTSAAGILELASIFTTSGTLTGVLNGQLNWTGTLKVDPGIEAILDFNGPEGITWSNGYFNGDGILTNKGEINLISTNPKYIQGTSTFNNEGTINVDSNGHIRLGNGAPTLNNTATGTINLSSDGDITGFNGTGTLINFGSIVKAANNGTYKISSNFINNNGTISVQQGVLKLNTINATLNNGVYNVSTGKTLEWAKTITLLGTLTGQLDGEIKWTEYVTVAPNTDAIFNFSGDEGVNWFSGYFNGEGTLTNKGLINLTGTSAKSLQGNNTILKNEGTINVNSNIDIRLGNGTPTLNNTTTGTIKLNAGGRITGFNGTGTLVNSGNILKIGNSDSYEVLSNFNNNNGTISVQQGTLELNTPNATLNGGVYNVTEGSTFEWAKTVTLLGTLTGQLDGEIKWTEYVTVAPDTEAIFNFSGDEGVNWFSGYFNGEGTLTNKGLINLTGRSAKSLQGNNTVLKNEGIFQHQSRNN